MVDNFESHVSKSVPIYDRGHELIIQLSDFFVKQDSIVYDIGCSTGKLLIDLVDHNKLKVESKFIGLDIEKDMIDYALKAQKRHNIKRSKLSFINKDITTFALESNDMTISYFSIQFIHPKHRQKLIDDIY